MGSEKFNRFKDCFEQFYLSHEIGFRKPNADIFEFVLKENKLMATKTLFIDDSKANTNAADQLDIMTWNLQVGQEDIIELRARL